MPVSDHSDSCVASVGSSEMMVSPVPSYSASASEASSFPATCRDAMPNRDCPLGALALPAEFPKRPAPLVDCCAFWRPKSDEACA